METSVKTLAMALQKRGLWNTRHEVCSSIADRHITSVSQLSESEIAIVIKDLSTDEAFGRVDFTNTRHRYILSLCYQLRWTRFNDKLSRTVADNERLGRWIKQYGKYKKPVLMQNSHEIGATIKALEMMLVNRVK